MAKEKQNDEAEAQTEDAAPKVDGRHIRITDPATGAEVKRVDWIREVYTTEGGEYYGDRGAIAKKLSELQGRKIPYQIVFAATGDLKHIKTAAQVRKEEKAAAVQAAKEEKAAKEAAEAAKASA